MYAQSPLDLPQHRTSHCHEIHLSTSYDHQLNPMADQPWIHPLQLMHDHPYPMVHLGSHQCTRQPTSVCAACLTYRQTVSGPIALADTATHHSHSYSLIPICGWTSVTVSQTHYIYRSSHIHVYL